MEYGAIDLHQNESARLRILTESGEVIDQRIRTTRDRLTVILWDVHTPGFWSKPRRRVNGWPNISRHWVTTSSWRIPITA